MASLRLRISSAEILSSTSSCCEGLEVGGAGEGLEMMGAVSCDGEGRGGKEGEERGREREQDQVASGSYFCCLSGHPNCLSHCCCLYLLSLEQREWEDVGTMIEECISLTSFSFSMASSLISSSCCLMTSNLVLLSTASPLLSATLTSASSTWGGGMGREGGGGGMWRGGGVGVVVSGHTHSQ